MRETLFVTKDVSVKYYARVDSSKGPDECWRWRGWCNAKGYGVFQVEGLKFYAHRVAYALEFGEIPTSAVIMHMCNNTNCCNPAHHKVGTLHENNRHKVESGRANVKKKNKHVMLKPEEVAVIKLRVKLQHSKSSIRSSYGCSIQTIYDIINGKTWRNIELPNLQPTVYDPHLDY